MSYYFWGYRGLQGTHMDALKPSEFFERNSSVWHIVRHGAIALCYVSRFHKNGPTQTYYVVELQLGLVAAVHCASAGGGGGSIFSPNQLF